MTTTARLFDELSHSASFPSSISYRLVSQCLILWVMLLTAFWLDNTYHTLSHAKIKKSSSSVRKVCWIFGSEIRGEERSQWNDSPFPSSQWNMWLQGLRWGSRPKSILVDSLSSYVLVHMLICDWMTYYYIHRSNRKISQLTQQNRSRNKTMFWHKLFNSRWKILALTKYVSMQYTNSRKYLYAKDEPHLQCTF